MNSEALSISQAAAFGSRASPSGATRRLLAIPVLVTGYAAMAIAWRVPKYREIYENMVAGGAGDLSAFTYWACGNDMELMPASLLIAAAGVFGILKLKNRNSILFAAVLAIALNLALALILRFGTSEALWDLFSLASRPSRAGS